MSALENDIVIRVDGLSKMFKVYHRPGDLMREVLTGTPHHDEFWALKDISFKLRRGEIMGVVGSNGAGKSTLLKLIAGTLDKTAGTVEVRQRISAILELGTSFNSEMTGRENVRTTLTYAGLKPREIDEKLDWIVAFSELAPVMDNPFRTYSTGMQARLTFSTAVASMEELLLIDEALAAGDAGFVNKALRYMEELCRQQHVSAIIVSHSMASLIRLCDRGLYLREGKVVVEGAIADVAREYESIMLANDEKLLHEQRKSYETQASGRGSGSFRILGYALRCNGRPTDMLYVYEDCEITIQYESDDACEDVWVGLEIYSTGKETFVATICNRNCRFDDLTKLTPVQIDIKKGQGEVVICLSPMLLGGGSYHFHFLLFGRESWTNLRWQMDEAILYKLYAGQFRVKHRDAFAFERQSIVQLPHRVSVTTRSDNP